MSRKIAMLVVPFLFLMCDFAMAQDSPGKVVHVYVIRRPLDKTPGSVDVLAHSGLLLKTDKGRFLVLEYMSDGKAHLTEGVPTDVKTRNTSKDIKMKGYVIREKAGKVVEFEWESQLKGKAVTAKFTPEELRESMQKLMSSGYSVWKAEHCHTAQERLRRETLGLDVPKVTEPRNDLLWGSHKL